MSVQFPQFLRAADFSAGLTATDIAISSGKFTQVGVKTVGAQQTINFGAGVVANGVDTRETATIRFNIAGDTSVCGQIRLAIQDANGIQTIPVYENNHTNFNSGVKLGLKVPAAREDSKLLLLYQPDTTDTIDYSSTTNNVNVPVTVTNLN